MYVVTTLKGIFRAAIPSVLHPYGKAATTWSAVKQEVQ